MMEYAKNRTDPSFKDKFAKLTLHFQEEMKAIQDETLQEELNMLIKTGLVVGGAKIVEATNLLNTTYFFAKNWSNGKNQRLKLSYLNW